MRKLLSFLLLLVLSLNAAAYDTDAQDYFDRVALVGSITTPSKDAIDAFVVGCKADSTWTSLQYVIPGAGATVNSMLVPLKAPVGVGNATGGAGSSQAGGFAASVTTGFNPTTHLTTDYNMAAGNYIRAEAAGSSDMRCWAGGSTPAFLMNANTNGTPSGFLTLKMWNDFGGGGAGNDLNFAVTNSRGLITANLTASNALTIYIHSTKYATDSTALTVARPNASLLVANGGRSYGLSFVAKDWTDLKQALFARRVQTLGVGLGWGVTVPDAVIGFGDSITFFLAATDDAHGYLRLYATNQGLTYLNDGLSGRLLQNSNNPTVPQPRNGRDYYASEVLGVHPDRVFVALGTNDVMQDSGTTGGRVGFTQANYTTQLGEVVNGMITDANWPIPAGNITIVSPFFATAATYTGRSSPIDGGSVAKNIAYGLAAKGVAQTYRTRFLDAYAAMNNRNGATGLSGDNLHPNNTGHNDIYLGLVNDVFDFSISINPALTSGYFLSSTGSGSRSVSGPITSPARSFGRAFSSFRRGLPEALRSTLSLP